jgi:hypothetical protein
VELRKRESLLDYETPRATQVVDARRPLIAFSIPAAFMTMGLFYISAGSSIFTAPSPPNAHSSV